MNTKKVSLYSVYLVRQEASHHECGHPVSTHDTMEEAVREKRRLEHALPQGVDQVIILEISHREPA